MSEYEAVKSEVLNCARWLCDNGYFGGKLGSGGNVSLYLRSENLVAITPSRKPYRSMSTSDISVIDPDLWLRAKLSFASDLTIFLLENLAASV